MVPLMQHRRAGRGRRAALVALRYIRGTLRCGDAVGERCQPGDEAFSPDVDDVLLFVVPLREVAPHDHHGLHPRGAEAKPLFQPDFDVLRSCPEGASRVGDTARSELVTSGGGRPVQELRVEQEHSGWPDENVVVVPVRMLEIVLAVPLGAQPLDLRRRLALTLRTEPPAERGDVAAQREDHGEGAQEEAGTRRHHASRYTAEVERPDREGDGEEEPERPDLPVVADVLLQPAIELALGRSARAREPSLPSSHQPASTIGGRAPPSLSNDGSV